MLQNFSLFPIRKFFDIIDHTRILNFIICICIKLHIHLYQFLNIFFSQCTSKHQNYLRFSVHEFSFWHQKLAKITSINTNELAHPEMHYRIEILKTLKFRCLSNSETNSNHHWNIFFVKIIEGKTWFVCKQTKLFWTKFPRLSEVGTQCVRPPLTPINIKEIESRRVFHNEYWLGCGKTLVKRSRTARIDISYT